MPKKPTKNDAAVSPVVGVILMVAITVVLAGVIAMFIFTESKTPLQPIQFTVLDKDDETNEILTITGETLFFRHMDSVSSVQSKHDFSALQPGKRYSCEAYTYSRLPHSCVYNCTEVLP